MAQVPEFLYPTWDYENTGGGSDAKDKKIWLGLQRIVLKKEGNNKLTGLVLLTDFLEFQEGKENFIPTIGGGDQETDQSAVAPFVVPNFDEINDDSPLSHMKRVTLGKYYNFHFHGKTFNGKVSRVDGGKVTFDESTVTMLLGTGKYHRQVPQGGTLCDVTQLKDRNNEKVFGTPIEINMVDVDTVQYEILRPYYKFLQFVDELYNVDITDCNNEDTMMMIMDNLGRLFVDSKLDVTGHPWRRVQMKGQVDVDDSITTREKLYGILSERKKKKEKEEEEKQKIKKQPNYNFLNIDIERINLDRLLWTKRGYRNEFKRSEPSVYDLFDVLNIPRTFTLEQALRELIQQLRDTRNKPRQEDWEPPVYKLYCDDPANRTRDDIWKSALVHCLHSEKIRAYKDAIINHTFLNPTIQNNETPYDSSLTGPGGAFKSNAFESFDQELAQNFATHMRANQDSTRYLALLRMPWPETINHLGKQPVRNRYGGFKFVECRYPEVFYLRLQREHDACDRLRQLRHTLSLSREKGRPVIGRSQVVAPDAFHTDYRTLPLPRVLTADRREEQSDYWGGGDPMLTGEMRQNPTYKRGGELFVKKEESYHPLYPSQRKKDFQVQYGGP